MHATPDRRAYARALDPGPSFIVDGFAARFVSALGPFGLSLPALACAALIAARLGARCFPRAPRRQQLLGGCVCTLGLFTAGLQLALYTGLFRRGWLLGALIAATAAAVRWRRPAGQPATGLLAVVRAGGGFLRTEWSVLPALAIGAGGLAVAFLAAFWLPVWQWDALGYHLPFVNFVLQGGGLAELPPDVPYLSTYPRNVELLFAALRALLPDDRLIDLGQLPLGLVGAGALYGCARELGAERAEGLVAGAAWLLLPAVFLQLPTNYVDVGCAAYLLLASYFVLLPPTRATLLASGAALGLFLGSKPSAPPAALLFCGLLLWRGLRSNELRSRQLGNVAGALLLAAALGLEAYVTQYLRHGNPVWPARVQLGPLQLPGTISVGELLASGAATQKVHGALWLRVLRSWSSFDALPVFDMRVGGMSLVLWAALPLALWRLVRQRDGLLAALLVIALITPDPAVARYVLAFPALVLAAAAAQLSGAPALARRAGHGVLALLGLANLSYAIPGLSGEGPKLLAYAGMSGSERRSAVGAEGRPDAFLQATDQLGAGEVAVFDAGLPLPYLLWRSDLHNRVLRVPDDASDATARDLLERTNARLLAVCPDRALTRAVAALPGRFVKLFAAPERCEVYRRP
jgi:hypothetical protein